MKGTTIMIAGTTMTTLGARTKLALVLRRLQITSEPSTVRAFFENVELFIQVPAGKCETRILFSSYAYLLIVLSSLKRSPSR